MLQRSLRSWLLTAALALIAAGSALSQPSTGRIAGVVRDATGGSVQGATATLTNQATGATRTATSASDGSYAFADVAAGVYTVSAELGGFRKTTKKDVAVAAGASVTADIVLEAGIAEEITVTGTRFHGRTATDTPAPVDYIDNLTIRSTGATETGRILQLVEPSFNFSTTFISDGTDIIRPATLRSLGPDQVLVLINGKRRHQQALLNVQQTVARGSSGYDINSIPASAIDHIEVLRDGAAAQYGSDAIAGVINVILKKDTKLTDLTFEGGQYYKANAELPLGVSPDASGGHGASFGGSGNTGFAIGRDGFLDIAVEYRDRGETNRAGPDSLRVSPARVVQRIGDPEAKDFLAWLNLEVPAGNGHLFAFGGGSSRKGNSSGFFRSQGDGRTVPDLYPNGYLPTIKTKPTDVSATVGYRGDVKSGWTYELSASYGDNKFEFREENTVNVTYFFEPTNPANPTGPRFRESPTSADTGTLEYNQVGLNADLTGAWKWGMGAGPLNIAAGAEWRREGYQIQAGEPVSYQYGRTDNRNIRILDQTGAIAQPGTQGFPGWSPREAADESRRNVALYVDFESLLATKLVAGVAARYENYSDFGSTLNGKASARVNLTDKFSVRGTLSTGFRAPSVQQEFYSQRSTNLNSAGVLTDTLTARQDSDVTRAFGIPPLKEETSRNYSLGFVAKPSDAFRVTADFYRIDIDDRIVFSSNIQPEAANTCGTPFSASRCPITAILNAAAPGVGQVLFFTNAIDTRTQGLDIVALYDWRLGAGTAGVEAALDFNKTEVKAKHSSSSVLPPDALFDQSQVTLIEEGQPRQHYVLSGNYRRGGWRGDVRFNYFGKVAGEGFTPGFKQTWSGKWITDASLTVPLVKEKVSLTLGGLNIFDVYPDKWDETKAFPFPQLGFLYGWETVPFGINGGYYYARLNLRLPH